MRGVGRARALVAAHPALAHRLRTARAALRPAVRRARAERADWADAGWRPSAGPAAARVELAHRLMTVVSVVGVVGVVGGGRAGAAPGADAGVEAADAVTPADAGRGRGGAARLDHACRAAAGVLDTDAHRWLLLSVLEGRLPTVEDVVALRRRCVTHGTEQAVRDLTRGVLRRHARLGPAAPPVRVLVGGTVVDVEHTSRTALATGIQRVARLTTRRWAADHEVVTVGWTTSGRALRVLAPDEHARAVGTSSDASARGTVDEVLVPWRSTYLLPELVTEEARYTRLAAMARFSGNRTAAVGFDAVPVTTAETTAEAMGSAYAGQLAALRHFDVVAPISHAAGEEFAGWADMCRAAGRTAPEVRVVPLAKESSSCTDETRAEVARRLTYGADVPLVLVVGSHEPRKNHRALLHAAERLWRDGLQFSLLFVGGNAWHSEGFVGDLEQLQRSGRLVDSVRGLPDDELWALYELAWCTAFPSLNEGFGLPVAESLAAGTPVLTSRFGSMREIAETGGALLVDPRDDDSVTEGLRTLLSDRAVHDVLRRGAAGFPVRTWQQYADELWTALTRS